jgi:penicillin-binding protein 1A
MTAKNFKRIYWIVFSAPFVLIITLFTLISLGKLGYMPTFEELENPKLNVATQIITQDTVVLDKLYRAENNRINVGYDELSPYLVNALIATEDIRYHRHSGIDAKGVMRAVFFMGKRGGASTISQQLAKLFYHERPSNVVARIWQKLNEWVIAVKLEKKYTKEEILAMYLNKFDFNNLAIGIKTASQVYYGTTTDSLKLEEAAMLVGMLKNPTLFNPVRERFADTALYRRNVVLAQMMKYNFIEKEIYDSVKTLPLELNFNRVDHNEAVGAYFREYVKRTLMAREPNRKNYWSYQQYKEDSTAWADDPLYGWCRKNIKPSGEPYNLYVDGLKIYTTINYKMQQYAEESIGAHLGGFLQDRFYLENKGNRRAPYDADIEPKVFNESMWRAMRNSQRGRLMRNDGKERKEIIKSFKEEEYPMRIFTWQGDKDTIMTPFDSICITKVYCELVLLLWNQELEK